MGKRLIPFSLYLLRSLGLSKFQLIAALNELPDDATICGGGADDDAIRLVAKSDTWESTSPGLEFPEFMLRVNPADVERIRQALQSPASKPSGPASDVTEWDRCYCDHAYTGERVHRSPCPLRKRRR